MYPRRKHHKSRKGCLPCKARRIKCDEQGPPCVNCVSRQTECSYGENRAASQTSSEKQSPHRISEAGPDSPVVTQHRNKLEIELMIQWSTETYMTMSQPKDHENWRIKVTRDALRFDFILNGVFAITALHIADTKDYAPVDRNRYVEAAFDYFGRFCKGFQQELTSVNPELSQTFLNASIMMIVLCLHPPQYHSQHESYLERIISCFTLLQGTLSLAVEGEDKQTLPERLERYVETFESRDLDVDTAEAMQRLDLICTEGTHTVSIPMRPLNHLSFQIAARALRAWFKTVHLRDFGTAFVWLLTLPRDAIELVRQNDPLALMILMHWAVFLEELYQGKVWWAMSLGQKLIIELSEHLQPHAVGNRHWAEALLWAQNKVGLDLQTISTQSELKER